MTCNLWVRKALSSCLMVAVIATYSMVTLASSSTVAGDLTVVGNGVASNAAFVTVNGESAKSGRSVFSGSTIVTPEDSSAVVSVRKMGTIQLAPNSTFVINFGENISGDLVAGKVTVLNSTATVDVNTSAGLVKLNAGDAATASGKAQDDDDDDDDDDAAWWLFAIGMGGALAGIIYATVQDSNRADLGGGGTVISPIL
jgi:hypothetical protein